MSAYIVDSRTIDYLATWVSLRGGSLGVYTRRIWKRMDDVPGCWRGWLHGSDDLGWGLDISHMSPERIGQILLAENVRSVNHRYSENEPTPIYAFRMVPPEKLRPDWVVQSCDCLAYQSCETPDWPQTVAHAIVDAIRESAIRVWVKDAPWGVGDRHLEDPPPGGPKEE